MTTVDKRDQIVTWDGNPTSWQEYVKRVRLQYERTEYRKRGLLGAELASRLTGRAWDVASSQLDHSKLQRADGAAYLLHFLEDRLCKAPIPDTGQRLEEFFMKIRRAPGSSMAEWASQLRESYRRLQRAMARQRKDQEARFGSPESPKGPSKPDSPSSSRHRRSDVTSPPARQDMGTSPFGVPDPATGGFEPGEPADPGRPNPGDGGYAELPTSETASNPGHRNDRWTADEWNQWYAERDRRWNSWYDSSEHEYSFPQDPDKDTIQWDQFGFDDVEILPQEILGWLLLRRSGLPASARLSVLSSIGNKLDLATMERAMRDQEEELLLAEAQRNRGLDRPKRSFWIEQENNWGLLADDVQDELEDTSVFWVGDRLPHDVYPPDHDFETAWSTWMPDGHEMHWEWYDDDFYACDSEGVYWSWSDTKTWLDMEEYIEANPSESQQTHEVYAAFNDRLRTFRESRTLNNAKQLSRGYYPMQMFKGKGKSKGKNKGKNKSSSKSSTTSPTGPSAMVSFGSKGGPSGKSGSPSFSKCFVCGSKDHDYRSCPQRGDQGSSSVSSSKRTNFFVGRSILMVESVDDESEAESPDIGEILATVAVEHPGFAVIDTGATETIASLDAIDAIMRERGKKHGPENVTVHGKHRKFRFGNGQEQRAASFVELPQLLAGCDIKLGVHTLDAPGVPLLLSVKTLRSLKAVVDVDEGMICFNAVKEGHWLPLKRGPNGHLLLDLTEDWFSPQASDGSVLHVGQSEQDAQSKYKDAASSQLCEHDPLYGPLHEPSLHDTSSPHDELCPHSPAQHLACACSSTPAASESVKRDQVCHAFCEESEEELVPDVPCHAAENQRPPHVQTSDDTARGSSMLRALPALIAIAASSTSPTTSYGTAIHGEGDGKAAYDLDFGGQSQSGDKEQVKGIYPSADPGALRHVKDRGPRPSRCTLPGVPLHGSHVPMPEGRGSLSGRNGHGMWKVCSICRLRIQYTPAYGAKATYRQAGPLAPDTDVALRQVGNAVEDDVEARENLNSKVISVNGAQESLKNKMKKLEEEKAKLTSSATRPSNSNVTEASKKSSKRENPKTAEQAEAIKDEGFTVIND